MCVCRKEKPATHFKTDAWIERIVILGISNSPKVIVLTTEGMRQQFSNTYTARDSYHSRLIIPLDLCLLLRRFVFGRGVRETRVARE